MARSGAAGGALPAAGQGRGRLTVRNRRLASLTLFILLAVAHTWPLATAPGYLSRNDNGDTVLNEWTIAWVAHQVPRDLLHLFDANIFYPERRTLALSEHLFVPAMMGAPLLWLGASPVLVYNLLLIAGFALTGWAASLVVSRWTGDWVAGLVAGSLMAFNALTLTRLPHLQAQHVEFFPLALLALDNLLRHRRVRDALWLSLWFTLQALTSNYLLVFLLAALTVAVLARPEDWTAMPALRALLPRLSLAAGLSSAVLLPFLLPYYRLHEQFGFTWSLDEIARFSATWRDYLATAGRIHWALWSHRFVDLTSLFPGAVAAALVAVAVATGKAFTDTRARMCLAFGVAGVLLSFGPAMPGYVTLLDVVPLLQGIRGAARFGYLALVAVAILAGFGVAQLRQRWDRCGPVLARALAIGAITLVNLEALRAPLTYRPFTGIPATYTRLAAEPDAVIIEFPFFPPDVTFFNAPYMLNSTRHWKPLVNGYSGFIPNSYARHYTLFSGFPDTRSLTALRQEGVTHIVVHSTGSGRAGRVFADAAREPALQLVSEEMGMRVYRLR